MASGRSRLSASTASNTLSPTRPSRIFIARSAALTPAGGSSSALPESPATLEIKFQRRNRRRGEEDYRCAARSAIGGMCIVFPKSASGPKLTSQRANGCLLLREKRTSRGRCEMSGVDPNAKPEEIADAITFLAWAKRRSSPVKSSGSTAARPPAEGNSGSRFIDRDCARE